MDGTHEEHPRLEDGQRLRCPIAQTKLNPLHCAPPSNIAEPIWPTSIYAVRLHLRHLDSGCLSMGVDSARGIVGTPLRSQPPHTSLRIQ